MANGGIDVLAQGNKNLTVEPTDEMLFFREDGDNIDFPSTA